MRLPGPIPYWVATLKFPSSPASRWLNIYPHMLGFDDPHDGCPEVATTPLQWYTVDSGSSWSTNIKPVRFVDLPCYFAHNNYSNQVAYGGMGLYRERQAHWVLHFWIMAKCWPMSAGYVCESIWDKAITSSDASPVGNYTYRETLGTSRGSWGDTIGIDSSGNPLSDDAINITKVVIDASSPEQ